MNMSRLAEMIAEKEIIGRPLNDDERIHFLDGNRANIHASNLAVLPKRESGKVLFYCPACDTTKLLHKRDILTVGNMAMVYGKRVCRACKPAEQEKLYELIHGAWECPNCGIMRTVKTTINKPPWHNELPATPLCDPCVRLMADYRGRATAWAAEHCNWSNWREEFKRRGREVAETEELRRIEEWEVDRDKKRRLKDWLKYADQEIRQASRDIHFGRKVDYLSLTKALLCIEDVAFAICDNLFTRRRQDDNQED